MKFLMSCCLLFLGINRTFSLTISTPGMQRKGTGENCVFQWDVNGNFTTYTIQSLSAGNPIALRSNTNHTFDSRKNVIKLWIWNIQISDAGYYSLSISAGPSTEVNSVVALFVYSHPSGSVKLAVGRNPAFEGDTIELNCSAVSQSLPEAFRAKLYYHWYISWYGYLRNISSGPAVLLNGDNLPGNSIKNDGRSLIIGSLQYTDNYFICFCQEEGSPLKNSYGYSLQVYSKPYANNFNPASRILNAAVSSYVSCSFNFYSNPPLTSYTNWSFINASGATTELPLTINSNTSGSVSLSFRLYSSNSYGNYSATLRNSNGSRTETFRVLPPGPPNVPSNFKVQYVTHSLVSLQWRCMWSNGFQQTVFIRLLDVANNLEIETQRVTLATNCYNTASSTLFQNDIQPETVYEASIWSTNTLGSSDVVKLAVRTPKHLIFNTSAANISVMGTRATITFHVVDSIKDALWLNVTCCVEITSQCSNKEYLIAKTDNEIVYDILPTGNEYIFDFTVYDGDGYTYMYTMAIVKGVRVSRIQEPTTPTTPTTTPDTEKANNLLLAVIVLAILLGFAILGLIGSLIAFLVCKNRRKPKSDNVQQPPPAGITRPSNQKGRDRTSNDYYERDSNYEQLPNPSGDNSCYTPLDLLPTRAKGNRY